MEFIALTLVLIVMAAVVLRLIDRFL